MVVLDFGRRTHHQFAAQPSDDSSETAAGPAPAGADGDTVAESCDGFVVFVRLSDAGLLGRLCHLSEDGGQAD